MLTFNRQVIKIGVLRITPIILVLRQLFDRTNFSLFLYYFWILLIDQTIVQPIKVIIMSSIYYPSSIVLWVFIYHLGFSDFWPVCFHWLDQSSLIMRLALGCVRKLYVGRIQTRHTNLLPPQVCGRYPQGFWLGVQTSSLQLIDLIDIKYTSSSLFKPYF